MNIIIPIAGLGSRFPKEIYTLPKPLIQIGDKPMIIRAIESLNLKGNYHFVIRKSPYSENLKQTIISYIKDANVLEIDYLTEGPACSALLFEDAVNNDSELVIANCDQIMEWNSDVFLANARLYDGLVVTYFSQTKKNSYARINTYGDVVEIKEKEVVSSISLNGIHYWKKGEDFITSAKRMIAADERCNNEFYIGPTYNYLIASQKKIGIFHIPQQMHHAVGVPEDLELFINYENSKNK